jgi:hypothetical protein
MEKAWIEGRKIKTEKEKYCNKSSQFSQQDSNMALASATN